jgi:MMPL family
MTHNEERELLKELEWNYDLPMYDRFTTQYLIKVIGISTLILIPLILLNIYASVLVALVILFTVLVRFIIQQGYRQVRFRVESRGAGFTTRSKQGDVYKGISFLLILMGIARSSPPAIVIGLQQSHTTGAGIGGEISWHDVRQVSLYPKEHVVLLKERWFAGGLGGGLRAIRLYCTPENYDAVAAMSSEYSKKS